jgi:hypothetical protein
MPTKEAIVLVGADLLLGLCGKVRNMLRNVGIRMQKVTRQVTIGVPSMAGGNSGVPSFITNELRIHPYRDLIICYCLVHQENMYEGE